MNSPIPFSSRAAFVALALAAVAGTGTAANEADEWKLPSEAMDLKPGKGRELVMGQCVVCHSSDYVTTQPRLARAAWAATVEKMRAKYGAPVPTNTVPSLVDYLVSAYGKADAPK
jgi:mono/diheme cytochrome c family protein